MIFKSILPSVSIPKQPIYEYVMQHLNEDPYKILLIDALTHEYKTKIQVKMAIHCAASGLIRNGFCRGDIMVIFLPNCIEYFIIFYSVLALGGTACLLNPNSATGEIIPKLKEMEREKLHIVASQQNFSRIKEAVEIVGSLKNYFVIGEDIGEFQSLNKLLLDNGKMFLCPEKVDLDDTAIIAFSSGTTNKPKGVMLTHKNYVSTLHMRKVIIDHVGKPEHQVIVMAVLPFFHIMGCTFSIGLTLITQATVVILPKFKRHLFLSTIERYKITNLLLVPTLVYFMAKSPLIKQYDLSSIKAIGIGGAPLSWNTAQSLRSRFNIIVSQGYALTENNGFAFSHIPGLSSSGSVGHLSPNQEVKIVDVESGEILGINKQGEIYFRGPNVMKGYINNSQATKEAIDSDGWLRTGDIGYMDNNNSLFVVDRIKELIKYKGFQVAPADLEAVLLSHSGVQEAAVVPIPDEEAGELPKAFIVPKNNNVSKQDIIDFVKNKVAPHMQLSGGVEFISNIPKTDTGKILRRQLKETAIKSKL